MVRARRPLPVLVCLAALLLAAGEGARGGTAPGATPLSEYQIKAAYLYYFTTFVDWPPDTFARTGGDLVIGVLGEDPFGGLLDETLRGKTVNNRRLAVRRFTSPRDARDCHLLFISSSERDRLASILKGLEGSPVLTVGDLDQFAARGGQIAFRMEDKKVRFDINAAAVERSGVKISAQLMKLGRRVDGPPGQGG